MPEELGSVGYRFQNFHQGGLIAAPTNPIIPATKTSIAGVAKLVMRSSMIPPITARNPPNRIGPVYMITPAIIAASPNNASNNRRNMEIGDSPPLVSAEYPIKAPPTRANRKPTMPKSFTKALLAIRKANISYSQRGQIRDLSIIQQF